MNRFGKHGMILLAVIAALLVGASIFAIEAEKPWGKTVKKRLAKQEPLQPKEYAIVGLWWAAVVNAGVLAALLGTAGRWMPRRITGYESQISTHNEAGGKPTLPSEKWVWLLVGGAVLLGAWERYPRLSHSLWNDEAYSTKRFVHGAWERQKDGTVAFEPVTWTDTLFENRNGNNHLLNSLVSRVSLELWRLMSGAPREALSETAERMPHFLVGLATIALMYLLGREIGSPLVGVGAAWLLALHPWHIRYAVEMRGYSLMLFFLVFSLLGLVRALRTDAIRWWLLFAVGEALYLLSFPGALYVAMTVNAVCLVELARRREWVGAGRLVAFNALAAVPVLQWMLPSIPQILAWLRKEQPAYVTDVGAWLKDLAAVIAAGWQYENPYGEAHVGTDWKHVATGLPLPPGASAAILSALCVLGVVLAVRRGTAARLIIVAPSIAALVNLAINLRPGSPMTVWYLIYLLIPATLAVYLTLEAAGRWTNLRWMPLVLCSWFTARYGISTAGAAAAVRDHDRQPMREAVEYIHTQSLHAITATFGRSDQQHTVYDSRVAVLQTAADLDAVIQSSRTTTAPLYVYYCSDDVHTRADANADPRERTIYARVVKSGEFEKVKEFPGSEELWSYRVYRLREAAALKP